MIERYFTKEQFDALIRVADRELKKDLIVFAPCFQTDDDWKQFRLDAHLLDMRDLHIRYNHKFASYVYSILSMNITRIQDPHERWAVAEEWVKKEYAKYLDEEYAKAEHEYEERIKRDDLDDLIDSIAAEHKKPDNNLRPLYLEDDPDEEAMEEFINGRAVILFKGVFDYCNFRNKYTDKLALPCLADIWGAHPEIADNEWPVVISLERCLCPASRYGVPMGGCAAAGKVEWAIAQSDWREVKRVSGKRIYVWVDKEWA